MTDKVVDHVTEREGKVHITTTISIDRAVLNGADQDSIPPELIGLRGVQRLIKDNKITLLRLGAKTYLGLVSGRTQARPLCIGDTLFLFVPRDQPLRGLAELITELAQQLPPDAPWRRGGEWGDLDMERLASLVGGVSGFSGTPSLGNHH